MNKTQVSVRVKLTKEGKMLQITVLAIWQLIQMWKKWLKWWGMTVDWFFRR